MSVVVWGRLGILLDAAIRYDLAAVVLILQFLDNQLESDSWQRVKADKKLLDCRRVWYREV